MLEYRLHTLNDLVDRFVIVEATHTFKGSSKPLFFEENRERFAKYLNKIIHVVVKDMPNNGNPWANEKHQRNCIGRGLAQLNICDYDVVMIADCDEIPDKNTVKSIIDSNFVGALTLMQPCYYYSLNYPAETSYVLKLCRGSVIKQFSYQCDTLRWLRTNIVQNGGWHMSYFGDVNFIQNKLSEFSHQEYNNEKYNTPELIDKCLKEGKNIFHERANSTFKKVLLKDNSYLPHDLEYLLKFFNAD